MKGIFPFNVALDYEKVIRVLCQLFETSFTPDGGPLDVETTVAVKHLGLPGAEPITVGLNLASTSDISSEMFELGTTSLVIPAGQTSAATT